MVRISSSGFAVLFVLLSIAVVWANSGDKLVRKRREWILPPKPLKENKDHTHEVSIAKIRSDFQSGSNVQYSLEGIGANQYPFHVFVVDSATGNIRVTKVLDREYIDTYNLSGIATFSNGSKAEKEINIRIKVQDENDNSPVFGAIEAVTVEELSPRGFTVTKVEATDADEAGNDNSKIAYSLINQNPPHDIFGIKRDGTIYVNTDGLDREKEDRYILTVKGQDLDGRPEGNIGTGTVTINVRDVNDNPPTLEKEQYEGSIQENTYGVEVMRIKAEDLDQEGTDNWEAVFDIVKGNEAGYFSIRTDPKTNEGILMLDKPVNYEDLKKLELGLAVKNKAPPYDKSGTSISTGTGVEGASGASGGAQWWSTEAFKTYPITINVKNQPEGPHFDPKVKAIPISEGGHSTNIKDIIAHYPAIDEDTGKAAENVRYAKGSDPDNWLIIDPKTAEIKLNKIPDRESPFLVNGTYMAEVLCITEDMPAKTATGTVAIQVEDFNDHCPVLTSDLHTVCASQDAVIVNAYDRDAYPNGPPFDFSVIQGQTKEIWQLEHLNDTAAVLRAQRPLWPGFYEVTIVVKDQQGEACPEPQKVKLQVCTCEDGAVCGTQGVSEKASGLGPAGIGFLLLGLLLLLFIPLLLFFCQCGGAAGFPDLFTEMPFDTKSHLIKYHTEHLGENTAVPLLNVPTQINVNTTVDAGQKPSLLTPAPGLGFQPSVTSMNWINGVSAEATWGMARQNGSTFYPQFEGRRSGADGGIYDGIALPDHVLGQYYSQKVAGGNDQLGVKDGLLVYDYEGRGSSAGSVGCSSLLESENDLHFLDDLGPKFKTLAEICGGKIQNEVQQVVAPQLTASLISTKSSSSLVTAQQLSPPPNLKPTIPKANQTVVRETTECSHTVKENSARVREGVTTVKTGMEYQRPMLLLQQQKPVYYTTTPILQPMHYVVQPQVQNTVLLADAPVTNTQSMVLVNNTQPPPSQGVIVQGQTAVMPSGQTQGTSMVLLENSAIHGSSANQIHPGTMPGSQTMMVVEGRVPLGSMKMVKGSQACLLQGGTLQPGGGPGSQGVQVVRELPSSRGQLVQDTGALSQKSDISGSKRVLSSKGSSSTARLTNKVDSSTTYHKVVEETREIH